MMKRTRLAVLMPLLSAAACTGDSGEEGRRVGDRVVREVTDTVAVIGGVANDTALFTPTMITFTDDGLAVWDRDRSQVLFFSPEGEPLWRYGSKGAGPGEFAGVTQIAADDQSRLWVLDPDNVRISLLGADGRLIRAFPIPDVGFADRVVPVGEGRALLIGLDPMIHLVDDEGRLLSSVAHPYSSYPSLHPLSAYNRGVHDFDSDSSVFFFYYGGGFARTDSALTPTATLTGYVEPIPFPEVSVAREEGSDGSVTTASQVNATRLAARGGAADHGVLHLLFQGDSDYGNRIIDRYSIGSGEYLGSWLLPDTARAFAVHDGVIATVVEEPVPALVLRRAPD